MRFFFIVEQIEIFSSLLLLGKTIVSLLLKKATSESTRDKWQASDSDR